MSDKKELALYLTSDERVYLRTLLLKETESLRKKCRSFSKDFANVNCGIDVVSDLKKMCENDIDVCNGLYKRLEI